MGLLVTACLLAQAAALAPQPPSPAAIVSGALIDGRLPLAALGLGEGGIGAPVVDPRSASFGEYVTPGGVLVRVKAAGVKLDFPSHAEVLIAPDGSVHLRSGEHTLPSLGTLEVWLADGTRLRVQPGSGQGSPPRGVQVVAGDDAIELWRGTLPMQRRCRPGSNAVLRLLALGSGDVWYRADVLGPLIALERVLAQGDAGGLPERRVVISGDVLAASLRMLPAHVPTTAVQQPHAPKVAAALAIAASDLFAPGSIERPPGAVGALVFELPGGMRLAVVDHGENDLRLALHAGSDVPVVEWLIGFRTSLHLLRPNGGKGGGPRYFLSGIDLTDAARALLPGAGADPAHARAVVRALGALPPGDPVEADGSETALLR